VSPLLGVADVTRRFQGVTAVSGVSMSVEAGEVVGLVGPNGAGKTTLVNVVTGNIRPSAGTVAVDGRRISGLPMNAVARRGVARTYQNLRLLDGCTVFENILTGRHSNFGGRWWTLGISRSIERAQRDHTERLLGAAGLEAVAGVEVEYLSYGLRRRVEIARALAAEPRVLVLDEPTAGMTRREATEVADLVRATAESGVAVLLVEHDVALVSRICDRVAVLDWGKLITVGPPDEVWADERVRTAYLGIAAPA
jgi:branched-chain amino acid transport system ATP-binding protein